MNRKDPLVTKSSLPLSRVPTWVLLLASGLLMGLAYPPNPVWLFGSLGLAPLLVALQRAKGYGQVIRWSYAALVIFSALSSWWIGSWQANADIFLMICCVALIIVHPFFFMLPLLAYYAVMRRRGPMLALALVPFFWCGGEYLHALTDLSYPWLTLGNTQTYNTSFIQFIEFTGVWGLSFVLVAQSSLIVALLVLLRRKPADRIRSVRIAWGLLAATLALPYGYGFYALSTEPPQNRSITVTAVQPNVNPWDKWKQADPTDHVQLNGGLSQEALRKHTTQMFLWTETAVPTPITEPGNERSLRHFLDEVDRLNVPVLSGFPDYMIYENPAETPPSARQGAYNPLTHRPDSIRFDYFNSAGMFVPGRGLTGAYHKMQLVPFGERIPFVDMAPFLIKMLKWDVGISSWGKGSGITVFTVPTSSDSSAKVASVICFESIYPNIVRQFTEKGAEFLTVITNDGWYLGTPGPIQHARFAMLRAVENRRSVARAANTGVSCFIDPYGRMIRQEPEGVRLSSTATVPLRQDLTLYVQWGDWFPQVCLMITALMLGFAASYPNIRSMSVLERSEND